jgi:cation:H+ antiporter
MFDGLSVPANAALFFAAAAVVWVAGTRLAHCADGIASATGIGREFLGMLLLGGVTSLPEVAVGVTSAMQGTPALSVNDVLGSAAINVVILAVADAASGREALTSKQGSPVVMLQGVLGIVLMSIVMGAVVAGDVPVLGIGVACWLILGTYPAAIWLLKITRSAEGWQASGGQTAGEDPLQQDGEAGAPERLERLVLQTVAAGATILVAGFLLAKTGEALAEQTGLGTSFFGAVCLGLSTSLPEVSTVIAAVRLKRYEMAISDIFGTNLFNVTIIVLVDALHPGGPVLVEAGRFAAFAALLALVLTALFLVGMLERRNRTVLHMGWDSLAALVVYAAGVSVLYTLK